MARSSNFDDTIIITATATVSVGTIYVYTGLVALAMTSAVSTGTFTAKVHGVLFDCATAASQAWTAGQKVYWDNTNSLFTTVSAGNIPCGFAYADKTTGNVTTAQIYLNQVPNGSVVPSVAVAAGTALTASSTETTLLSATIPANKLRVGDVIRVRAQGIATATNSTDTLTPRLRLGTTIAGTAVSAIAATDVANSDIFYFDQEIVIRTIGASGTYVAAGVCAIAATGVAPALATILASTAIDTTVANTIYFTGQWSTTSASNSCRGDMLTVTGIPS